MPAPQSAPLSRAGSRSARRGIQRLAMSAGHEIPCAPGQEPRSVWVRDLDPVQVLRPVRETALVTVVARQEVVAGRTPSRGEFDRLVMTGKTGLFVPAGAGIVEPALVGQRSAAVPEIVKKPDDPWAGGDTKYIGFATLQATRDQSPMKAAEERVGEGAVPAAGDPRRVVQRGQPIQELVGPR